ncbi:MAG: hypothetical protein ACOY9Y_09050 [Bacillota bacterium]
MEGQEVPDDPSPVQTYDTPTLLAAAKEAIHTGLDGIKTPSYQTAQVTSLVKKGRGDPRQNPDRPRPCWGNVVHRALEAMVKNQGVNLDILALTLLQADYFEPPNPIEGLWLNLPK